jgi:hypothetical protein
MVRWLVKCARKKAREKIKKNGGVDIPDQGAAVVPEQLVASIPNPGRFQKDIFNPN